jgi:hypothetical protein
MARTAMIELRKKQARAMELVRANCTFDEIADDLGYANRSSAWRLVRGALDQQVAKSADEYLQLELDRLDTVQVAFWDAMVDGDMAAATIVLKVIAERIRVLGLDRERKAGTTTRTIYDPPAG